jgi:DNA invertase Pin-like site-specific DNA recombinase
MRVGYARVSTASGEQLAALESQRHRLMDSGVDEIIEDVQSGRETDRTGYLKVLDLIERRQVEEVVITRVDRLGRDAADTDAAIAFAAKRGVKLTALDGGAIESETPAGFVMSRIMTTMAEMESRMLSLRINAGLNERRKQGRPLRGRAPWGYRIKADKTALEPDPREWPRAQQFIELMQKLHWRMNPALDAWDADNRGDIPLHSCRSVRAWLMNPILRGGIGYHQKANHVYAEVIWGTHQPLLTDALYEEAMETIEQNRRLWGHNAHRRLRLLTGLCVCGHCHKKMVYAPGRRIWSVMCRHRGCPQQYKSVREEVVRDHVNVVLASRALELATQIAQEPPEATELRSAIRRLEALEDPDLADAIRSKKARLDSLLRQDTVDMQLVHRAQRPCFWRNYSYEELVQLYQGLVREIVISAQKVEDVRLRF